ncbi:MAG TPA: hypothetical protein VF267_04560 [Gammaproteobacteria bacterium]
MQKRLPNETPAGWLARIAGAIVGVILMAGLFFLGITVFAAVAGLAILVFLVLAVRVWWLRRRFRRHAAANGEPASPQAGNRAGVTLEGEYEERRRRDG